MYGNKTREQQVKLNPYIGDLLAMDNVVLSPHIAFLHSGGVHRDGADVVA